MEVNFHPRRESSPHHPPPIFDGFFFSLIHLHSHPHRSKDMMGKEREGKMENENGNERGQSALQGQCNLKNEREDAQPLHGSN